MGELHRLFYLFTAFDIQTFKEHLILSLWSDYMDSFYLFKVLDI